jgi:hypothetical protein
MYYLFQFAENIVFNRIIIKKTITFSYKDGHVLN